MLWPRLVSTQQSFVAESVARWPRAQPLSKYATLWPTCVASLALVLLLYRFTVIGYDGHGTKIDTALQNDQFCPPFASPSQSGELSSYNGSAYNGFTGVALTRLLQTSNFSSGPLTTSCHLNRQRFQPVALQRGRVLLAMNLSQNEAILPNLMQELAALIAYIGPERVHVSCYENGSTDRTPMLIQQLASTLMDLRVAFTIHSGGRCEPDRKAVMGRIPFLAHVRNQLLLPLRNSDAGHFETVLIVNDIWACASDILEVLLQLQMQGAVMSTSTDYWMGEPSCANPVQLTCQTQSSQRKRLWWLRLLGLVQPKIYDVWVLRTNDGRMLTETLSESIKLAETAPATPAFASWNGIAALQANVFVGPHNITFRSRFGTDEESECFLLCVDLWKGRLGKIVRSRRSRVAYTQSDYECVRQRWEEVGEWSESERVVFRSEPPPKVQALPFAKWDRKPIWKTWDDF